MAVLSNFWKSVLPRLTSEPAVAALEKVNVKLTDAKGNLRDIMDIYTEVSQRMVSLTDKEQTEIIEGLAGKILYGICPFE